MKMTRKEFLTSMTAASVAVTGVGTAATFSETCSRVPKPVALGISLLNSGASSDLDILISTLKPSSNL